MSSSLLTVTGISLEAEASTATHRVIDVEVQRFDDYFTGRMIQNRRPFLKIDAQGSELEMIEGASAITQLIIGLKVEHSLENLYEGQSNSYSLDRHIRTLGFEIWDIIPGFQNRTTGRLLQFDAIYFRRKIAAESAS